MPAPVPVLLTVPHLNRTASPYRETMAMARYLAGSEFRLTICALREKGFQETAPVLKDFGVNAFVAPFRPTGRTPAHLIECRAAQSSIDRWGAFAIQHSLDFTSSPLEAALARKRSRIFIYNQRNLNENGHELPLRWKARLSHRIVCISRATEDFLLARGVPAGKLRRVSLGIDLAATGGWRSPGRRERGLFLFVGQFERRKRHDDAIRALAVVAREDPRARLALAGNLFNAAYVEELKGMAARLGVADRVEFLGIRSDIPDLMRRAQAVVLCSESEAFGWVILEAMATGTPVIASAVDGPAEIIEHGRTGLLVPCRDIAGYAAAMRLLMVRPEVGCNLALNARRVVEERFSAGAMVERIQCVYREALEERN